MCQEIQRKGKFIVMYGINNLGKSTQAHLLVHTMQKLGKKAEYLKYPVYTLGPTGPKINEILRKKIVQNISEENFQSLYAQNRRDFEPRLLKKLCEGVNIVAEDYIGTGLAWGITKGADPQILECQNQNLLPEDIAILLDGERFLDGKEDSHLHEESDKLMKKCRETHRMLAKKLGWHIIHANQPREKVQHDIWEVVALSLSL